MTGCPDTGAIRSALDNERPDISVHLQECASCRERADELRSDAAFAAAAFAESTLVVDTDAALAKWRAGQVVVPLHQARAGRSRRPWRAAVATLLVVATGGVLATPPGSSVAASVLERFRSERVAVVPVNMASVDPAALEALADVAKVEGGIDRLVEPQEVSDLRAAAKIAGFDAAALETAELPANMRGPVRVLAQAPQTVRVTFPEHADVPAAMRNTVLVLGVPGAIVQTVGSADGAPGVVRGEAGSLEVSVEGEASLAEVRDALLSLPGIPPETVAALREIDNWETTMPLPVPSGVIAWKEATVAGHPGVSFGDETGVASALLWRDGDRFVGVGGRLPLSQVRQLAEAK